MMTGRHVREEGQRRRFQGRVRHSVVGNGADEAQRSLGADHQVGENIEAVLEIDQAIERVAGGVLEPVLVTNALGQRRIRPRLAPQRLQRLEQLAMRDTERRPAIRIRGIEQRTVGENDANVTQRAITVLCRAAAHARGVVGGDPPDHAAIDRSRIGADLAAVRRQQLIGARADDPRLQPDRPSRVEDAVIAPSLVQLNEHRVGHRLPGKRRARRAKRHQQVSAPALGEHAHQLFFAVGAHAQLRDQPIEAGIGAIGEQSQRVVDQLVRRQPFTQCFKQLSIGRFHRGFRLSAGGRSASNSARAFRSSSRPRTWVAVMPKSRAASKRP